MDISEQKNYTFSRANDKTSLYTHTDIGKCGERKILYCEGDLMKQLIYRLTEPARTIPDERKIFSNHDLKILIVPLFLEQLLEVLVGVADTFMVSYAGEAAVSGVSLVNMFNTVFIYLFSALAAGGAVVVSQYIGSRDSVLGSGGLLYA